MSELPDLLQASGRLEIVDGERSDVLGPGYRFHVSHGHTPGLLATEIPGTVDGLGTVLHAADLVPGRPWAHAPITMGYDRFPERLVEEKTALFEDLLARGGAWIYFPHDPEVACARLDRDERGRFTTTDERAELAGERA